MATVQVRGTYIDTEQVLRVARILSFAKNLTMKALPDAFFCRSWAWYCPNHRAQAYPFVIDFEACFRGYTNP